MPMPAIDPVARKLMEAEGYLTLNLPHLALEVLQSRADWATMQFEACFLTGEAFRMLERYRDALRPLEIAASLRPSDLDVALAQGWCYKRTHRLAQAIDALERAERHHPRVGMVRYNLACYWSLAGNARRALAKLAEALKIEPERRADLADEADFDPLRGLPEFGQLLRPDPTPSK